MDKKLSTEPYKGVRDFYPDDMAVQRYIFDVWSQTAESFGYARYDASVLEPSALYKAKGAENEEMVNEQTYTFTDRGDREVTLRPEMTPTVARMIAAKSRELAFPVRWYSIPNLFRYERAQRGRLREHWQLNCDIFGASDFTADIELIALAYQIFINFGATEDMFEIRVNDRQLMHRLYTSLGLTEDQITGVTRLNDKKAKISPLDYRTELNQIVADETVAEEVILMLEQSDEQTDIVAGLAELGITNVTFDKTLARGFDYYTGTIFEIFDTNPENNRAMLGGGRYDNLTSLFSADPVSGIGFGMGDVTMRQFLESNDLLTADIPSPTLMIMPVETTQNLESQKIAQPFRQAGISVSVDMSNKKVGKKLDVAGRQFVDFALIVGEDEIASGNFVLKNLTDGSEESGTIEDLIAQII